MAVGCNRSKYVPRVILVILFITVVFIVVHFYKLKEPEEARAASVGTLDSFTFDTGVASGSQLNSILWRGVKPSGSNVQFQFATADSENGPFNFIGPDGTSATYYAPSPDVSTELKFVYHRGRFFRYRVRIDGTSSTNPRIDEIIINWSP